MAFKKVQSQAVALYNGCAAADVTMRVTPYPVDLDGNKLTMAALGANPQVTVDSKVYQFEEIIGFTGIIDNGDNTGTITGLMRDLASSSLATPGTGKQHGAGATVIFSWNPQDVARLPALENANTFTNQNIFSGFAPQTDTDPVSGNDLTRLSYVQALVLGTLTTIDVIVPGTAGVVITAGQSIYLDTATDTWKLTNATSASTVNNVLLGIAQGVGAISGAISGGVLLQGVDTHQTGLTPGNIQYASNTPGAISSSAGTISTVLGAAKSATQLYFAPRFNQQVTQAQLDAMAGDGGTPGSANKFVTQTGFQNGSEIYTTELSGAGTAYTGTYSPAITVLIDGMELSLKIAVTNSTTTPTFSPNGLTARTIVKLGGTALAIGDIVAGMNKFKYDLTNTRWVLQTLTALNPATPYVGHQRLPYIASATGSYGTQNATSETDGSVIYIVSNGNGSNYTLSRYARDATTGIYYCTHIIATSQISSSTPFSLTVIGTFLYLTTRIAGTAKFTRFLAADLTGETTMTISGTSFASGLASWTDGTYIYVYESSGVFRQYSISGTVATNVTTITFTSSGVSEGAICDGVNVWLVDNGSDPTLRKYAIGGGAATATRAFINWNGTYVNQDFSHLIFVKTGILGMIFVHTENSPTAIVGFVDEIIPFATI